MVLNSIARKIDFFINFISIKFSLFRILILYGDCVKICSNFQAKKLNLDINPHNAQAYFGNNIIIRPNSNIRIGRDSTLKIGNNFFSNSGLSINVLNKIEIGNDTMFGENVKLYDHNHGYKSKNIKFKDQSYNKGQIKIGCYCWVGSNVIILKDVNIGDNCVIGANNIIHKDIPSNTMVKVNQNMVVNEIIFS